jgi:hypothetical protein
VYLHGLYLNILFIFNSLHQVCIGIEIANMERKERVSLNFRELSPDFGRLVWLAPKAGSCDRASGSLRESAGKSGVVSASGFSQ